MRRIPIATAAIAAACVALFALGHLWAGGQDSIALYRMGANVGADVKAGQLWRLWASTFLHGGAGHLFVNLIALGSFGPILEALLGPGRYLVLYGLCGLGGGVASALLRGPGLGVGASGAIWGLMTAGIALVLRPRDLIPPDAARSARGRALVPLGINVLYSFQPGIDLYAHFGGGAVGFLLMFSGLLTLGLAPGRPRRGVFWPAFGALIALGMAGSVGLALGHGRPWELRGPLAFTRVKAGVTPISLELPAPIAGAPELEVQKDARVFTYGRPLEHPLLVELVVAPKPGFAPAELDGYLDGARQMLQKLELHGAVREGDARIEAREGRRYAVARHRLDALTIRSYVTVLGDQEVLVRTYARAAEGTAWAAAEARIAGSVERIK